MSSVEPTLCETEQEYLNTLSLTNDSWWEKDNQCDWIFRGQKSSDRLIPSLYRNRGKTSELTDNHVFDNTYRNLIYGIPNLSTVIVNIIETTVQHIKDEEIKKLSTVIKAAFIELGQTEKFLERCNRILLPTPTLQLFKGQPYGKNSTDYFYNNLEPYITSFIKQLHCKSSCGYGSLFVREYLEAMALARHHSVSSRLLDWTEDPLIAAFFSVANSNANDGICVWALNKRFLRTNSGYGQIAFYDKLNRVGLEFMHLQKGLFTDMLGLDGYYYEHGKWPNLDQYLLKTYFISNSNPYPQSTYLKKIELKLNSTKRSGLLKRLERMGINKYTLMPTYDNVSGSL